MIRLVIEKMSKGGFVVYDGDGLGQGGLVAAIYAATDIADALAFIGDNLAPVEKAIDPDSVAGCSAYCASGPVERCSTCPHDAPKHRKLYEPAADGSVNWAG